VKKNIERLFLVFVFLAAFPFVVFEAAAGECPACFDVNRFQAAAENGNPDAQTALGTVFREGKVVPRDLNTAAYWFDMAARQGHFKAQEALGNMFARGEVQPPNNVFAYLMVSVTQKSYPRCPILKNYKAQLISHMAPAEIEEAERLLRSQ